MDSSADQDIELEGWQQIAGALGVDVRTAMRYRKAKVVGGRVVRAALPVEKNFREMVCIRVEVLQAWKSAARRSLSASSQPAEQAAA